MAKAVRQTDTDAQSRKRGEQIGLDTLVVHVVNDGGQGAGSTRVRSKRIKPPAWVLRSQE